MWIVWLGVGVAVGWLVPQPMLTWQGTGERVGLLKWVWLKARDAVGMN